MKQRLVGLRHLYDLYDAEIRDFPSFCRKGCDLCCTANVTLTSLEAELIFDYWREAGRPVPSAALEAVLGGVRFQPAVSINRLAEICAGGGEGPDEAADPLAGPCPLLENGLCSIYPVRPFGCRAMQSVRDCRQSGAADMPDWLVSANTLFLQFIEAADLPGITGNLTDVLQWMAVREDQSAGRSALHLPGVLTANRPLSVLMIPPEHRERLQATAQSLHRIVADFGSVHQAR